MNRRLWELDALRGLMLVLMTVTHLPTRFSSPLGQPFGFVSAAEGFVMLSGVMAGMVYTARERRDGEAVMREAFLRRAWKIYLCQAALMLFLFTVIAFLGLAQRQDAITNMIAFYFEHPLTAFWSGLLLVYNPPLLDILPMYIVFMLVSPLLLVHGLHRGWAGILAGSVALWVGAQFGLSHWLYDRLTAATGFPVPFPLTGSFEILGWQLLWVMGLWLGSGRAARRDPAPIVFPRWMVATALALAVTGLLWRHAVGQVPFPAMPGDAGLNLWFDKWRIGPLRMLDFMALTVLAMHFAPWLTRWPRQRWLETLGAASLPVFCAHLVLALLLLALAGDSRELRPWALDALILFACGAVLMTVAEASAWLDRRAAALRARVSERRARRAGPPAPANPASPANPANPANPASPAQALPPAAGAVRSPSATGRSPAH